MDADEFSRNHPDLADALTSATAEPPEVTAARRAVFNQTVQLLVLTVVGLAVLALGRWQWGWGEWSLIGIGVVGASALGGLVELAALLSGRVLVLDEPRGEVRDR